VQAAKVRQPGEPRGTFPVSRLDPRLSLVRRREHREVPGMDPDSWLSPNDGTARRRVPECLDGA